MNPNLKPADQIQNQLGLSETNCPGVYGDLWMLLKATKAARPELFDPITYRTPVDQFLSQIESFGISLDSLPGQKTVRVLSCLLYTSPSPRDKRQSRMPSSA